MSRDMLEAHLREHWVAASTGCAMFNQVSRTLQRRQAATVVADLAKQVQQDRVSLGQIMSDLGVRPSKVADATGRIGAAVSRLKPKNRGVDRSGRSDVRDVEALRAAVAAKAALWESLLALSDSDKRLSHETLQELLVRAERQMERLRELHVQTFVHFLTP